PRRLICKPVHVPCRRQEHLLQDVLHFHRAAQLPAHLVMHQHRQPPLILPEDQAEGLGVASFESLNEVVCGRLGAHLLPLRLASWGGSYSIYTRVPVASFTASSSLACREKPLEPAGRLISTSPPS